MLGRATLPSSAASLSHRALQPGDEEHVEALQLDVQAERDRHAAALDVVHAELAGEVGVAQLAQLLALERLVGDEDLGLVERNVERLLVGDLGADQAARSR